LDAVLASHAGVIFEKTRVAGKPPPVATLKKKKAKKKARAERA
jgi:hypothetical protein